MAFLSATRVPNVPTEGSSSILKSFGSYNTRRFDAGEFVLQGTGQLKRVISRRTNRSVELRVPEPVVGFCANHLLGRPQFGNADRLSGEVQLARTGSRGDGHDPLVTAKGSPLAGMQSPVGVSFVRLPRYR